MILHVVDTEGKSFYVTQMNAVDAATGQARVIFVDPAQGKTFVHLYADFFRVVTTVDEDGSEGEVPQYQVIGVVEEVPQSSVAVDGSDRSSKKKKSDKLELKARPVRTRDATSFEPVPGSAGNGKLGAEARSAQGFDADPATGSPTFSASFEDESQGKTDEALG
jgi:hypothetical protein